MFIKAPFFIVPISLKTDQAKNLPLKPNRFSKNILNPIIRFNCQSINNCNELIICK